MHLPQFRLESASHAAKRCRQNQPAFQAGFIDAEVDVEQHEQRKQEPHRDGSDVKGVAYGLGDDVVVDVVAQQIRDHEKNHQRGKRSRNPGGLAQAKPDPPHHHPAGIDEGHENHILHNGERQSAHPLGPRADAGGGVKHGRSDEDEADPEINAIRAVKEGKAARNHAEQEKDEGLNGRQDVGANELKPAHLVAGIDRRCLADQRRGMKAAHIVALKECVGLHPHAENDDLRGCAGAVAHRVREGEHGRLGKVDDRPVTGKIAEAANQRAVIEGLVDIVEVGGAGHGQLDAGPGIDADANPVPGITPVSGMAFPSPSRNKVAESGDGVKGAGLGSEIDGLPI